MAFDINEFKANFTNDGARPTQFSVSYTNPADNSSSAIIQYRISAASLPAWNVGIIQVPYFGRYIKTAGDREFENWRVRVLNEETFDVRDALENWSNQLNSVEGNIRTPDSLASSYKSVATVTQYDKTGNDIRDYTFYGLWPSRISEIRLDWSEMNQIEYYDVEFAYDYYEITGGTTGNAGLSNGNSTSPS